MRPYPCARLEVGYVQAMTVNPSSASESTSMRQGSSAQPDFVVIDVETACSNVSSICQIGIVGFRGGVVDFEYETLVDPLDRFSSWNVRIHGITAEHVFGQPCFADVHAVVDRHLGGRVTVSHSYFDKGALAAACRVHSRPMIQNTWLDSVRIAKRAWPQLASHRLNVVAAHLGIPLQHHDALSDARAAGLIVVRAIQQTGIPLGDWLAPPSRRTFPPAPKPAPGGPLSGQRVAVVGQPRHGPLAQLVAAAGGRVMTSVGTTTTIVLVAEGRPFGPVRYDAHYQRALDLQALGGAIRILSADELAAELSGLQVAA